MPSRFGRTAGSSTPSHHHHHLACNPSFSSDERAQSLTIQANLVQLNAEKKSQVFGSALPSSVTTSSASLFHRSCVQIWQRPWDELAPNASSIVNTFLRECLRAVRPPAWERPRNKASVDDVETVYLAFFEMGHVMSWERTNADFWELSLTTFGARSSVTAHLQVIRPPLDRLDPDFRLRLLQGPQLSVCQPSAQYGAFSKLSMVRQVNTADTRSLRHTLSIRSSFFHNDQHSPHVDADIKESSEQFVYFDLDLRRLQHPRSRWLIHPVLRLDML